MARRKRSFTTFNLSFLDIMSCGFGAVVLVFLIIDHAIVVDLPRELFKDGLRHIGDRDLVQVYRDHIRLPL